jgi:hypothetical protein
MKDTDWRFSQVGGPVAAGPDGQLSRHWYQIKVVSDSCVNDPVTMLYSRPMRLERTIRQKPHVYTTAGGSLVFRPTDDGWRLTGAHGTILLQSHAHATQAPRLELASAGGDLDVSEPR